ncbi:MAG: flagellar biosynthetic protein FliR [bacterium]
MIITLSQVMFFLLIFSRLAGAIFVAPFFANKTIFAYIKVVFLFWLSLLLLFKMPLPMVMPQSEFAFFLALIIEFFFGYLIGFIASLIVTSVEFAGTLMDTQAGLSVAAVLDPGSGQNAALLERLLQQIVIIIFLLVDGHHMILSVLEGSFETFPVGQFYDFSQGAFYLLQFVREVFVMALRLAAPILLVVFLVDFGFGLLNRVAEQINVFQLGFQLKPTVSLFIFMLIIPGLVFMIVPMVETFMEYIFKTIAVMR